MASYGLLKGLGGGLKAVGEDISTRLRDERLNEYKAQMQQVQFDRDDKILAKNREYQQADKADDRSYQEGLLQSERGREDSREAQALERAKAEAAYTDTATENGKQFKVFFNKQGQEIGRAEMGDAKASTVRQYLDPAVKARLDSLDKEISAIQRSEISMDDSGKAERLRALVNERDSIQYQLMGQSKPGSPKPGRIAIGYEEDGYRFTGGNPKDPNAWVEIK